MGEQTDAAANEIGLGNPTRRYRTILPNPTQVEKTNYQFDTIGGTVDDLNNQDAVVTVPDNLNIADISLANQEGMDDLNFEDFNFYYFNSQNEGQSDIDFNHSLRQTNSSSGDFKPELINRATVIPAENKVGGLDSNNVLGM